MQDLFADLRVLADEYLLHLRRLPMGTAMQHQTRTTDRNDGGDLPRLPQKKEVNDMFAKKCIDCHLLYGCEALATTRTCSECSFNHEEGCFLRRIGLIEIKSGICPLCYDKRKRRHRLL